MSIPEKGHKICEILLSCESKEEFENVVSCMWRAVPILRSHIERMEELKE